MNTTPFLDKQIMDLSHGSSHSHTKDFIDLMNHPKHEEEEQQQQQQLQQEGGEEEQQAETPGRGTHHPQIGGNGISNKDDDVVPSYDFQPLRPFAASHHSSNYHSTPNFGSAFSNSNSSPPFIRNYGSLDSIEPAPVIVENNRNAVDASILSDIDRTLKKHMENLLHVMEGVSARLTQLESRTHHLENSVDDLKVSFGNNLGSTEGKMRQLENILLEVQTGVQYIKDKQDIVEAQLRLAKLQVSKMDKQSETQTSVITDPVQQAASAPQQSQQQVPSSVNIPQSVPVVPPPNAPPQPHSQQGLPPPVQLPNQFSQNQIPSVPQREAYFPPPLQSQDTSNQQFQLPLAQQPHPHTVAPPHQQYQQAPHPQFPQSAPHLPQQQPSLPPVNLPQLQSSLGHHAEETPYVPSQNYSPNLRQPPSQPPSGPPPSQQFYGGPPHVYEPPSSRPASGFSSGYGAVAGPAESYRYGGSPQYGGTSALKPPQLPPVSVASSGGSAYPQLPTARVLPQAVPTASGVSGGSGSAGTGNRVSIDDVVDKVASMGFPRDHVRATVRKLTENGHSVDLNAVLDKLMNDGEVQPPRGWFGR